MRRREFVGLIGGMAVSPIAVASQSAVPRIGYLAAQSPADFVSRLAAFREGLKESGFSEGENVVIEFRWGEGSYDRLPTLAEELARRPVNVIAAVGGSPAVLAAKAATQTIPIVFEIGADPVALGLVISLSKPGGNLTGVTSLNVEAGQKRLEILHEIFPTEKQVALLVNPTGPTALTEAAALQVAATSFGLQLNELRASSSSEIDVAFSDLRSSLLVIIADPFFTSASEQLAALAIRHRVAAIHQSRRFTKSGGLISYGGNFTDSHRIAGNYTGRILRGEKPADLAVQQTTKIEMAINLTTANALGIHVPPAILARADEVIE